MKEIIAQFRTLLTELERKAIQTDKAVQLRAFSGLELPDIIRDVVDLLMPELKPYEAPFYLYFLRHSIIENGTPHFRVSRRGLMSGVVKSIYFGSTKGGKDAESATMSYGTAQQALEGLETIGAIRQEGEPNRDGTLYRVLLPEEIEVCQPAASNKSNAPPLPRPNAKRISTTSGKTALRFTSVTTTAAPTAASS